MKNYFRLFGIVFIFVMASIHPAFADTHASTVDAEQVQTIVNNLVTPYMAANAVPGIAVAVYYKGHDYFYNYGVADESTNAPVTKDTIFELASVSKIFATSILAVALQNNEIKLTDPIVRYLPELKTTAGLPIDTVTVLNLATHTASFPDDITDFGVETGDYAGLMQALRTWQPSYPIGTQYQYSNIGFGLLGIVVQNAVNQSFMAQLNNEVLGPIGMTNTMAVVPPTKFSQYAQGYHLNGMQAPHYQNSIFLGGGALRSSAADLLKLVKENLGIAQGSSSRSLMLALQIAQQPYFTVKPDFIMGLGWQRVLKDNQLFLTKNGVNQGFSTFVGFAPQQQIGIVFLANKSKINASKLASQILFSLAQAG